MTGAKYLDISFISITVEVRKGRQGMKGVLKKLKSWPGEQPKCNYYCLAVGQPRKMRNEKREGMGMTCLS